MSAAGVEVSAVDEWLRTTLAGDATLTALVPAARVQQHPAHQGSGWPVVTTQFLGGTTTTAIGSGDRLLTSGLWLVRAIGPSRATTIDGDAVPTATLRAIVARFDALLRSATVSASSGVRVAARPDSPFSQTELEDGARFVHMGHTYRIEAYAEALS